MAFKAALMISLYAAVLSQATPADQWFLCQSDFQIDEDTDGIVNLDLDGSGHPQNHELLVSGSFEAEWRLNTRGLRASQMTRFTYFVTVNQNAAFPVTLRVEAEGHPFWTGVEREPRAGGGPTPHIVLLFAGQPNNAFPNIFGVRRLRFTGTDARGAIVASATLRLPDWQKLERRTNYAIRQNERAMRRHECPVLDPPPT